MKSTDPFKDEQARRIKAIEETNQERLNALLEAEGVVMEPPHLKASNVSATTPKPGVGFEDIYRVAAGMVDQALRADASSRWNDVFQVDTPRFPRIGGWEAGNNQQDHPAIRFEIEAERALFMGKTPPKDEELRKLHSELDRLHVRYQQTGNPSLLIGIADMTAQYNKLMAEAARRKRP